MKIIIFLMAGAVAIVASRSSLAVSSAMVAGHAGGHSPAGGHFPAGGHAPYRGGGHAGVGVYIGVPLFVPDFYYAPYYYYPPVVTLPAVPPAYIEQDDSGTAHEPAQAEQAYWYYCVEAKAYYPYVKDCPGGWQRVVPSLPPAQ